MMHYDAINQNTLKDEAFQKSLVNIAVAAGAKIMEIYASDDFGIETKDDQSPVTLADLAANAVIEEELAKLTPNTPLISEENVSQRDNIKAGEIYWLIDPLDGTKEFIKRNGDFTVNIALIQNGAPVFGVVYAPARDLTYWGGPGFEGTRIGAWKNDGTKTAKITTSEMGGKARIVASASHLNDETQAFIDRYPGAEIVQAGSSIKICMIADGRADLYPRLAPTCEWDTGAADAVLRGAGGMLFQTDGSPLIYGKEDILNPSFIGKTNLDPTSSFNL